MSIRVAALVALAFAVAACGEAPQQDGDQAGDQADLIAFSRTETPRDSGPTGIFIARPDGTNERLVTPADSWYMAPTWSPDGKQLAYVDGGQNGLYTVTLDGMQRRLVTRYASKASALAWAPDGRSIALTVALGPHLAPPTAALVPAKGGGLQDLRLPDVPETSYDSVVYGLPAWSPDSRRLAYTQRPRHPWFGDYSEARTAAAGIYTIDLDGRNRTRVTKSGPATDHQPTWLPDGKTIIFLRQDKDQSDLWAVRPDGTGLSQLTEGEHVGSYDVSRDGRRLAWANGAGIYEGPTDGGDERLLGKWSASSIDWSPDGKRIVFADSTTISVVVVATGRFTRLTPRKTWDEEAAWRPR
jgi:Tol biopolymer transport system component